MASVTLTSRRARCCIDCYARLCQLQSRSGCNDAPCEPADRLDALCVLLLISYFLHFALAARHGGFREDEMLNLWAYWYLGPVQSLFDFAKFWTPYYRPRGVLYYLPLYHFFGLNSFPYRIVQISILALSIPIAYWLARVLAFCYHP
jgi:hypothetical protein